MKLQTSKWNKIKTIRNVKARDVLVILQYKYNITQIQGKAEDTGDNQDIVLVLG